MTTTTSTTTCPPAPQARAAWCVCPGCEGLLYERRLADNDKVCPECGHHFRLSATERLSHLLDRGSLLRFGEDVRSNDPLRFADSKPYPDRLAAARRKTGHPDAAMCCTATIRGHDVVVVALDFGFMGGSVGAAVGELVCQAARCALRTRTPLLIVTASGGARMQEGCVSLMQMARTAADIARLHEHGVLVINLNVDPTFGGATASFATLGDIVLSEPGALIGFAGPNVIRQTIRSELPDRFQTAEFLLEHGTLDQVVPRGQVRDMLARLLDLNANRIATGSGPSEPATEQVTGQVTGPVTEPGALPDIEPAQLVVLARETERPTTLDYLTQAFEDFIELHGDGEFADDPAIVGGLARLAGRTVVVVGHQKGRDLAERVRRNFAMPNPEGYRKVLRLAHLAGRLGLPLVTLVDTPGAYPGIGAEERGQGNAIARCIHDLSRLPVPIVSVVTGEGGSGGALALAVADEVLILQHAYYSVISPEGCSTILFGAADSADRAAQALALRPADLLRLGVVDAVITEPDAGAHTDGATTAANLRAAVAPRLARLAGLTPAELVQRRYRRFERFGLQPEAGPTEEEI